MTERFKVPVLKTGVLNKYRGFKSHFILTNKHDFYFYMIQLNTKLFINDNSGVKKVKCIKITGGSFVGSLGSKITVAVHKVVPNRKIKAGDVTSSLVIGLKKNLQRKDGSSLNFFRNTAILLNSKNLPVATRIFGPIPRELRQEKNMKVVSIAQGII